MKLLVFILIMALIALFSWYVIQDFSEEGFGETIICPNGKRMSDFDQAIELYRKAINENSDSSRAYSGLGLAYAYKLEKYYMKQAVLTSIKGIKSLFSGFSDKKNDRFFSDKENNLFIRQAVDEAFQACRKAIELNPDNEQAYYARAYLNFWEIESAEVIKDIEQAIRIKPDYVEAQLLLARAYELEFGREKALEQVKKTLAINPGYNPAKLYQQLLVQQREGETSVAVLIEKLQERKKMKNE